MVIQKRAREAKTESSFLESVIIIFKLGALEVLHKLLGTYCFANGTILYNLVQTYLCPLLALLAYCTV